MAVLAVWCKLGKHLKYSMAGHHNLKTYFTHITINGSAVVCLLPTA